MGSMCASCTRKEEDLPRSFKDNTTNPEKHKGLFEFIESNRATKYNYGAKVKLQKANKLNMVMNSASNYWLNENESLFDGSHRTTVTYHVENISQLIRVHNSIITENEYQAAKKIKDLYFEYKRRKQLNAAKGDTSQPMTDRNSNHE